MSSQPLPRGNPISSRLPLAWAARRSDLSADCQLYLTCRKCGGISRVPCLSVSDEDSEFAAKTCGGCHMSAGWDIVTFRTVVRLDCQDCHATNEVALEADQSPRCPQCDSINVATVEIKIRPPFPDTFLELDSPFGALFAMGRASQGPYLWGRSAKADVQRINAESKSLELLPDGQRYLFSLRCFTTRLHGAHLDQDPEGRYLLANIDGNLAQAYFRKTGSIESGFHALSCFSEMIERAPNPLNRATAQHTFAMGAFALLSQTSEGRLGEVFGVPNFRKMVLGQAQDAESVVQEEMERGASQLANLLGRIRFLIGDLLRVGNTNNVERRSALDYFRRVYNDPAASQGLQFGIGQSWAHTVFDLSDATPEELQDAVELLQSTLPLAANDRDLANVWRDYYLLSQLQVRRLDWGASIEPAKKAAAAALQQFSALSDEELLLKQAETFVPVFEHLALILAATGAKDDALNTVELSRAVSIRLYTMGAEDRERHLKDIKARHLEDLLPAALKRSGADFLSPKLSHRDIIDFLWDNPLDAAAQSVLSAWKNESTAFISIFLSNKIATGIIYARNSHGRLTQDCVQWQPVEAVLSWLREQRYLSPGPFREPLIEKACRLCAGAFLLPLAPIIKVLRPQHILMSAPGIFSRLPFEAALKAAVPELQNLPFAVSCLPSLRVGYDIIQNRDKCASAEIERVLLVGYDGDDMPHVAHEVAEIKKIWGDRLTAIEGSACNKRAVIEELRKPYDIIHFLCHGTYDAQVPLESALHFTSQGEDDSRRVTARDLLQTDLLPKAPLIILAACSSGLTADTRTNSFHGLPGSFFRLGARAIVGSRWPVDDESASQQMIKLHGALVAPKVPLDATLAQIARDAGDSSLEDTAAFAVFGIG